MLLLKIILKSQEDKMICSNLEDDLLQNLTHLTYFSVDFVTT